jgi:hypothetical protein
MTVEYTIQTVLVSSSLDLIQAPSKHIIDEHLKRFQVRHHIGYHT